jgi:general secretion pathway protein G
MNCRKTAFTLVEILIVVTILGILAAIVVPQYVSAEEDAKLSNLMSNLQSIRAQLELYKLQHDLTAHNNSYPTNINPQLTRKTRANGIIHPSGSYGPYLTIFPPNPFVDDPVKAVKTDSAAGSGWSYTPKTGVIVPNTAGHGGL